MPCEGCAGPEQPPKDAAVSEVLEKWHIKILRQNTLFFSFQQGSASPFGN
jgi:hypothetical protein